MAYADVSDIESRWRTLTAEESTRAAVLLEDASAVLDQLVDVDPADTGQEAILNMVCCNMVARQLDALASQGAQDITNMSMTAGPYSQSITYATPVRAMYPNAVERKMLGIGSAKVYAIRPKIGGSDD